MEEIVTQNATEEGETYTDNQGNTKSRVRLALDRMTMMLLGKGASFKFASPQQGFTTDIRNMLKVLFLLMLDFTRVPEVVWGNEMSAGRSSASESMKSFYSYIQSRRVALEGEGADELLMAEAQGGLHALIDIWLRIKSLTDSKVIVAPVKFQWTDLSEVEGELKRKWTAWAHSMGLMLDETALAQAPVALVRTPAKEVALAKAERQKAQDAFNAAVDAELDREQPDEADEQTEDVEDTVDAAQDDEKVAA
jgi:hypothetical protein